MTKISQEYHMCKELQSMISKLADRIKKLEEAQDKILEWMAIKKCKGI